MFSEPRAIEAERFGELHLADHVVVPVLPGPGKLLVVIRNITEAESHNILPPDGMLSSVAVERNIRPDQSAVGMLSLSKLGVTGTAKKWVGRRALSAGLVRTWWGWFSSTAGPQPIIAPEPVVSNSAERMHPALAS